MNGRVARLLVSCLVVTSSAALAEEYFVSIARGKGKDATKDKPAKDLGNLVAKLKDGDTIVIPGRSNVVRLSGEVQVAQAVVWGHGLKVRDYVRLAGGYTQRANRDQAIVIHASAAVTMGSADAWVNPGDEVLIPPKVDRKILQNAADLTQVIYQIAVAAAVVLAL